MAKHRIGPRGLQGRTSASRNTTTRALVPRSGRHALPQINLPEVRRATRNVYVSDHPDVRRGTRIRWLVSTVLAAGVAISALGLVLFGSIEKDSNTDFVSAMRSTVSVRISTPTLVNVSGRTQGKTDRLTTAARGMTTRHVIHDTVHEQRDSRTFVNIKPYVRVVARLSSEAVQYDARIPPFNPVTLFAPTTGDAGKEGAGRIRVTVLDLPGGFLPADDNQELSDADIAAIIRDQRQALAALGTGQDSDAATDADRASGYGIDALPPEGSTDAAPPPSPNARDLVKNRFDDTEGNAQAESIRAVEVEGVRRLQDVLVEQGVEPWQAKEIALAARGSIGSDRMVPGQQLRLTMTTDDGNAAGAVQSASLFGEGDSHLVTVTRNAAGAFVASGKPRFAIGNDEADTGQRATLYDSLYRAALAQGLTPPMIMSMVRTFANDTDFKRRVSPGDGFEAFFDLEEADAADGGGSAATASPRNLLFIALTAGGETRRFYRFRLPEGGVDYFDKEGNNAKKFLLRRPVRGADVRFTSGYGVRIHPILKVRKMHTGVDWAAAPGTPVIAAGNGVIEEIGRKGGNGNYIRIKHANGYQTAYSHLSRFHPGMAVGTKVMQNQVIGYVGSTGFSSGPHLHYEVLINRSFVDPMTIPVPRERQLTGKVLADFQREQARIDALMGLAPVSSVVNEITSNNG